MYPYSKESLLAKLNQRDGEYHRFGDLGDYLIKIKSDDRFFLGVERGSHAGTWYIADVRECDGGLKISGRLVYHPDEDGNAPRLTWKDHVETAVLYIFFSPLWLVSTVIGGVRKLIYKIKKLPQPRPAAEEKLDTFMCDFLGCKKTPAWLVKQEFFSLTTLFLSILAPIPQKTRARQTRGGSRGRGRSYPHARHRGRRLF